MITYGMVAPVELAEACRALHRTLLLGMKASRVYHFRIVAESARARARAKISRSRRVRYRATFRP